MKKIIVIFLIISLILGTGIVFAYQNLNRTVEGEIIDSGKLNNEDFFEIGKQFRGNESNKSSEGLFSTNNQFNALVTQFTSIDGLDIKEAKKRAFDGLVQEKALIQAAQDKGIVVTNDEAREMAEKARKLLENPTEKTYGINIEMVNKFIEGLGITEEEYWNKFAIDGYKSQLLQVKLKNEVVNNVDYENIEEVWTDYMEVTINDYIKNNSLEIEEFKKEIGVNF